MTHEDAIQWLLDLKMYIGNPHYESLSRVAQTIDQIIELLTEQEEVVHPEPSCEMEYITDCCCDLCGEQLIREDNFCRCCGKRIEWKGR